MKRSFIATFTLAAALASAACAGRSRPEMQPTTATDTTAVISIGQVMSDGSIYAGLASDGRRLYTTDKDARVPMNFTEAQKYADTLSLHGKTDWIVPTTKDLTVLSQNKLQGALKGSFNGANPRYWSSEADPYYSNSAVFKLLDGSKVTSITNKGDRLTVRAVRYGEKRP